VQERLASPGYLCGRSFEVAFEGHEVMQPSPIGPRDLSQAMRRGDLWIIRREPKPAADVLEFGRFRALLRQRQLLADGVPIALGTRAFDLLLVLLEADGALVTKEALLSRVWPGIVVAEENLKVQISALRKALGEDRDFIRTDFRRGYRFTAAIRPAAAPHHEDSRLRFVAALRGCSHQLAERLSLIDYDGEIALIALVADNGEPPGVNLGRTAIAPSALRPAKLSRGSAEHVTEMAREMALVRETRDDCDFGQ
jgi:DNA-binding winged helix-turn-helix (wHTH) protein